MISEVPDIMTPYSVSETLYKMILLWADMNEFIKKFIHIIL